MSSAATITPSTGKALEVTMAKPQTDKKSEIAAAAFNASPNYLPPQHYGFAGNPYGAMGTGYGAAAGYQQKNTQ